MQMCEITNVTASGTLNFVVDIDKLVDKQICRRFKQSKSNKNFNGVIYRNKFACVHIYKNGKVNIMGGKSRANTTSTYAELCDLLQAYNASPLSFSNFCATTSCGHVIERSSLFQFLKRQSETKNVSLEPELFPSIKWDPRDLPSTVNIFRTGKINSTGNKNECQARASLQLALTLIRRVSSRPSTHRFKLFEL